MKQEHKHCLKRVAAAALVMLMVSGTVPYQPIAEVFDTAIVASASITKSASNTTLGTSGIGNPNSGKNSSWTGNYVYYGKYDGSPVKYRVLANNTANFQVSGGSLFLDCNTRLYKSQFGNTNKWATSMVKSGLNGSDFLNKSGVFTTPEKDAIATSKTNIASGNTADILYTNLVGDEKIFLLDYTEVTNSAYGYNSSNYYTRKKDGFWILRSARKVQNGSECINIDTSGAAGTINATSNYCWVSPAFNVKLNSILFSTKVNSNSGTYGNEYKLTVKDESFGISETSASSVTVADDNKTITVPYTVTDTDSSIDPNTVSVLIKNTSDNIIYYAPLSGTYATSGTGIFTLPNQLKLDDWGTDYNVSILAEKVNGEHETDYASALVPLSKPKKPVTYTQHPVTGATCTEPGNIEYYEGSDGKNYSKNGDSYTELTNDSWVIPAKGHDWSAPTYVWSNDDATVTATRICKRDSSHVEAETVNTTAVTKDPTCVDKGQTTYTATFTNTAFETQTKTIETDNATGIHTYSERSPEWSWVKNGNTFDVSVKFKCAVCDEYETTNIRPTLTVTESNGIRKFTATVTHDGVQYTSERDEAVKYSITINGTEQQYKYGEYVTATAPAATNGQYFDGWYEGETKVSSSEVYTLYATRDMIIHAEYKDTVVEAEPVYVLNVSDRTALDNGKQKVSFTYDWDLPEGYTLVKAAIVRSYVETDPDISTAYTNVHYTTLKNARGTYKLNLTLGTANVIKTVYVRGYIVYKDKTGTEHKVYTDVLTSKPLT